MDSVREEIDHFIDKLHNERFEYDSLDGDEVEFLAQYFEAKMNLINGNITEDEFNERNYDLNFRLWFF